MIAKSCSQPVNLPGARPLMNPLVNGNSKGEGDFKSPISMKESMTLKWNFQRGGGFKTKKTFHGRGMDISGTTHFLDGSLHFPESDTPQWLINK